MKLVYWQDDRLGSDLPYTFHPSPKGCLVAGAPLLGRRVQELTSTRIKPSGRRRYGCGRCLHESSLPRWALVCVLSHHSTCGGPWAPGVWTQRRLLPFGTCGRACWCEHRRSCGIGRALTCRTTQGYKRTCRRTTRTRSRVP